jgi:hypothetical protein
MHQRPNPCQLLVEHAGEPLVRVIGLRQVDEMMRGFSLAGRDSKAQMPAYCQ